MLWDKEKSRVQVEYCRLMLAFTVPECKPVIYLCYLFVGWI